VGVANNGHGDACGKGAVWEGTALRGVWRRPPRGRTGTAQASLESLREEVDQIAGDERYLSLVASGQVPGEPVDVGPQPRGLPRTQPLSHEGRDDAGQHVARSPGRHAGVASGVEAVLMG